VAGDTVDVAAQLVDAHDNPVAEAGRTITWSSSGGGGFVSPTSTTDAAGAATVRFVVAAVADTSHVVTASDPDASGSSPTVFTRVGEPVAITPSGVGGDTLTVGSEATPAPSVRITDAAGN